MDRHQDCVNTIKGLAMDGIQKANSGHPGMPMGMASAATVLWRQFLKHDPSDPSWFDRDRFVLSPGHGSMLHHIALPLLVPIYTPHYPSCVHPLSLQMAQIPLGYALNGWHQ